MKEKMEALLKRARELAEKGAALTPEEQKEFREKMDEGERLRGVLADQERLRALETTLSAGTGTVVPPAPAGETRSRIEVGEPNGGKPLFATMGEFVRSLVSHTTGQPDPTFVKYLNGADKPKGATRDYTPVVTGDAGPSFLIPANLSTQVMMLDPLEEIIAPRAKLIPAGNQPDAQEKFPALVQGTGGVFAGVNFSWSTEAQETAPEANPATEVVTLTPHEVIGTWNVSGKVLRNAEVYNAMITETFQKGFSEMRDRAFVEGGGSTLPLGILNSACKVTVNRAGVGTLAYADVLALRAKMHPRMLRRAIWIAATDARSQIEGMKDGDNRYIWGPGDVAAERPETLCGLPLFFYDHASLGEAADLALVVPDTYLYKQGFGPALGVSEHAEWRKGLVAFRLVASFDGACWVQDPLTLDNGHIVSPVATLKATTS
jgi:HK97 family phage major capsid protein